MAAASGPVRRAGPRDRHRIDSRWHRRALAEVASRSNSAFVRLDIKRRDVLTGTITSPLLGLIRSGAPASQRDDTEIPTALDLPQVPASEVATPRPVPLKRPDAPRWPDR